MKLSVCKRVNNSKRKFLLVNEQQCKHVPHSPLDALGLFDELSVKVNNTFNDIRILVVGFAETATAIGWRVAEQLRCDYVQTTREHIKGALLVFSESHSHATRQTLTAEIDYSQYSRIIFVEDEVTTGNTIRHLIELIEEIAPGVKFGVAALLSGLTGKNKEWFKQAGIPVVCIEEADSTKYGDGLSIYDGAEYNCRVHKENNLTKCRYECYYAAGSSPRLGISTVEAATILNFMINAAIDSYKNKPRQRILVLGTEEFMYPAIRVGAALEIFGHDVVSHSTTRSPIFATDSVECILKSAVELPSVYDENRTTYVYNLGSYDSVLVITEKRALNTAYLLNALMQAGNDKITVIKIGGL